MACFTGAKASVSTAIADGFRYADCPGHPTWLEPTEWLGAPLARRSSLHLVANNPTARLHSQLDVGAVSQATKVQGREPIRIHPADPDAMCVHGNPNVLTFFAFPRGT